MIICKIAIIVMLWAVTLWRLPSAVRNPGKRTLWVCFAALALAITLGTPVIGGVIDQAVGVVNASILAKNLFGVVDCAAALEFVVSMARPQSLDRIRKPHRILAALAMIALIVLFAQVPMAEEVDDFYHAYAGHWGATAYSAVFIGYLGIVMAVGTWLFWSYSRHTDATSLRVGLRLLATGTAAGLTYTTARMEQMLSRLHCATPLLDADLINNIEWAAIALILAGNTLPACGVAIRSIRDRRALRAVRPLWESLTSQVPDVVLTAQPGEGPRLRLHRLIIEVRDSCRALAPYADETVRECAIQNAQAQGLEGDHLKTMAEALTLRAAHAAKAAGHKPAALGQIGDSAIFGKLDLDTEIRRLNELSKAFHSPTATAFVKEQS
ncbi:MAB_1171c family putative transporter [Streptomyces sp. NPDC093707]|uniref:MAB_1171c family putative transporter n=1 Tax=Streptomyces sp. NPDC093707 TaxID=3154984 RepID=UPI00344E20DB